MKTYSLNEVSCSILGVDLSEQIGKITITPNAKRFTPKVGVDGKATLSENKDNSHTVKIQMMASSESNTMLSAAYTASMLSPAGTAGVGPFICNDTQGTSLFVALSAVITGWPEKAYEPECGDIEWEIFVEDPLRFEGGN
jgi:hypothetical protein